MTAVPPLHLHAQARKQRKQRDAKIQLSIKLHCWVVKNQRRNRPTLAELAAMPEAPF